MLAGQQQGSVQRFGCALEGAHQEVAILKQIITDGRDLARGEQVRGTRYIDDVVLTFAGHRYRGRGRVRLVGDVDKV